MTPPAFDPLLALETLLAQSVRFVVIGGFAGRLWGSPTLTNDLDVCYARDDQNLKALAAALNRLEARLRDAPADVRFPLTPQGLQAGDHFTLVTRAGNLDCIGSPAGARDFERLWRAATEMDLDGLRVRVAALEDLIRMKRAAGRPKDRIELEVLGALAEEIDRRPRP
jgi:hypothetical protein